MDCLACHASMQGGFPSAGAEGAAGYPYYLYRCLTCDMLCKDDLLTLSRTQTWLFANGTVLTFSPEALEDAVFRARFDDL